MFPEALWFDLLMSDVYERLLRETVVAETQKKIVIIDEIQRIPELLNEVHWPIANTKMKFIMSGSSPRKILRSGTNLLGGRALRYELYTHITMEGVSGKTVGRGFDFVTMSFSLGSSICF